MLSALYARCEVVGDCIEPKTKASASGYKRAYVNGVRDYAHRQAYRLAHGEIPDGLEIDHLCSNRACCRVEHLEAVDHRTNVLRGNTFVSAQASQTGCRRAGHPLVRLKSGKRYCRICSRDRKRALAGMNTSSA